MSQPLDIGTLANIIKHADQIIDMIGAPINQMDTALERVKSDATERAKLHHALDGLRLNLRVLKASSPICK